MPRVPLTPMQRNLIANLTGSCWGALLGLICTPLYIHFLGIEAYGLIGFFLTMQALVQILDLGLSPTMNREMARYSVLPDKAEEARDFVRTLEIGYWAIGILIGLAIVSAAPFLSTRWIRTGILPVGEVRRAVEVMGILAALQWPCSLYQGGLLGLQRQVLLNGTLVATSTLGNLGAVLVLWKISPTVTAFFHWQIGVYFLQTIFTTAALWRSLPDAGRPARIVPRLARNVGGFAAGMSGISITTLILTQLDKLILSKLLDLKTFGYYTLASFVGSGLLVVVSPMFQTIYPRFCALVAMNDEKKLRELYHGSTQILAVILLPVAAVLILFSKEVLMLWTRNEEVARYAAPIASILVAGTALNGMAIGTFALQLAYGWTRIGLAINTGFILTLVPGILYLCTRYGPTGAASAWLMLNMAYVSVVVPLTHRRLLKGEGSTWLALDFSPPFAATAVAALIGRALVSGPMEPLAAAATLFTVWLAAATLTALVTQSTRQWIASRIASRFPSK